MSDIKDLREQIDQIDNELVELFDKRMKLAKSVGDYKRDNNIAILDPVREQEIVDRAVSRVDPKLKGEVILLMRSLMALAREYQRSLLISKDLEFLPPASLPKVKDQRCVFQGVSGAWGEQAAKKLFPNAALTSVDFFEDVFLAIKNGDADYGVVPIENSQTGAIGETYDLLRKYGCYIVGRTWIDIKHCLMGKKGAKLSDIRDVYSHPEGFRQCHNFLHDKPWDIIVASNTAVAARKVRDADSIRNAAIGSRLAAELSGLEILAPDIMDSAANRTSFVVIGTNPEYDDESDLVSIMFSVPPNRSGALCEALLPFMASGINLTRIESRPTRDHKYRFFAELAGNIKDPALLDTLQHAAGVTDYLEVIGCYKII